MSSIAARAQDERTNRWLLIGAAALALITGILAFAAVALPGTPSRCSATSSRSSRTTSACLASDQGRSRSVPDAPRLAA
mgnify:CR=1 FL=1